jgi:HlyD family secretion protein
MNVANLYTIADLDNMQVVGNVDEADIGQVKVGQSVTFTVDAYPDDMFDGEVTQVRLNPTTESNVVTYEVIVAAANPEHKLIPGLTANLTIYITREKDILLVPNKALLFNPKTDLDENSKLPRVAEGVTEPETTESDERVVWVVKDNTLTPTLVKIGTTNGVNTQIISGLKEKDVVAIDYDTKAVAEADADDSSSTETSPFAPQPPGKNKKK